MAEACEVWFYHLERSGLDHVLPELLEKTLQRGWRAAVRTPDPMRLDHLDGWLWSYRDESFLPHGLITEPHAEAQPIVLGASDAAPNRPDVVFLIDGAPVEALGEAQRCVLLFDGRDPDALAAARTQWKAVKAAGFPASYWRQAERGWEKQA